MASRAEDDGTRATSIDVPSLASTQILIELLCFAELHARHENRLLISSASSSSSSPRSTLLDHFLQGDSMAASSRPHCFSCDRSLDRLRGAGERVVGRFSGQRMDLFKLKGWPFHEVCSISLRGRSRGSCMRWDNGGASVSLNRKAMAEGGQGLAAVLLNVVNEWKQVQIMAFAGILACMVWIVPSAYAADALKTCTCLLKECRVELAKCIANPSCAANVACLQTCNNRPDETECQIKCGDLFENSVVDEFNECAVSRKKCVPRKNDVGEFPVPDFSVLDKNFDIGKFSGKWYITSGLNPTFDTFDCQVHEFHMESGKLVGNLTWRIRTPDTGFFTRSALQKFVQDPSEPGILYNHDNEYLHYQDDWYILSSKIENKDNDYVFVYYRGRNDAWDGYGGAVIYTRSAVLPQSIVPELEKAAKNVGRDFSTFIRTDNTCGPEPPLVERLEKTVEEGEKTIIREVEEIEEEVEKVGKTEMTLFQRLSEGFKELVMDEQNFLKELSKEEMEVLDGLKMEAAEVDKLFGRALPIRKLR